MNIYLKHLTKAINTAVEDRKVLGNPAHKRHQTVVRAYKALLEEKGYHTEMDNKTILQIVEGSNLDISFSVGECLFGLAYIRSMKDALNVDKIVYEDEYIPEKFVKDYLLAVKRAKVGGFVIVDSSSNTLTMRFLLNALEGGFRVAGVKKVGKLRGVLMKPRERKRAL